ncbi:MAG TPA: ABC transporter ATP-binding protein, partial [Myxococcota bacterium]|nr:ABC transporter ATP-binding protein [Myxococcota bacterium]
MDIDIRNLSKSYYLHGKEIPVLRNLSLYIAKNELISLTGPSGVGKSTFLHVLGTLDTPSSGTITYDDCQVHALNDAKIAAFRNKHIGYVFQFHHLLSELSALENVMMPLLMRRQSRNLAQDKAKEMLAFVGLSHRVLHKPGELSGGEQQRVALARALAHGPTVLLADEPTGNLDEKTGQEIVDLIFSYNESFGTTVVLVTHNQRISNSFKKRLTLTKDG